jgi:hypothetical protein
MRSYILLAILFVFNLDLKAQTFEIAPSGNGVFYDVIEWKGMGALLMSRDAGGSTKQITLTLIGEQETSVWEQKFNPKADKFYYISSENARYVYFLDQLDLDLGYAYFSQLNSAGNIKSTKVSVGAAIKKLRNLDINELKLVNVVVTDKALVHHFRYYDKESKSVVEFASFITHHNFLCYAVELGSIPNENFKNENVGNWEYIGFTGDEIYFAARDLQDKKKGWMLRSFDSKSKPLNSMFVEAPQTDLIPVENIGFGATGKHYLSTEKMKDKGLLAQINGKIYLTGGRTTSGGAALELYELAGKEWKLLNEMKLNYFIPNKTLSLGVYPMNEGIGYHLDHNGYNKVSMLAFDKNTGVAHNSYTDRSVFNPSAVFNLKEKAEFTVTLPSRIVTFNTDQLTKSGPVKFEYVLK